MANTTDQNTLDMTKITTKGRINFAELVSEATVARIAAEEEELAEKDAKIGALKQETLGLLEEMEKYAEAGDEEKRREIRNEVVVLNLRLVTQVLKKYGYFSPDKFQNGCVGLLKAADTFSIHRGVPFHNYAAFCIETEVRLAFRRVNRMFESKAAGFLDSLDAQVTNDDGSGIENHERAEDEFALVEFDAIIADAEVDTLFYDIIIPCIEAYGTRAKDIDMELWKTLEIQYFIELSMESSQRQRITFTEMAKQLGTTPQNIRSRHKKIMELLKKACREYGYDIVPLSNKSGTRLVYNDGIEDIPVKHLKGGKRR